MGNIHQLSVANLAAGKVGQIYGDPKHYIEESFGVSEGRTTEVTTYVVDTATNGATYDLTVFGETVEYTADGSAAKAEITAGLKAAADANPVLRGVCTIADDAVDTLTITSAYPGLELEVATTSALVTVTITTAGAEGDTLPFGRAVMFDSNDPTKVVAFAPTAKAVNALLTYDAAIDAVVTIEVNGTAYVIQHTQATDADTSVIALATQINALLPANTVEATHPTADTLTLTAEVVGLDFTAGFGFGPGTVDTGAWTVTTTAESAEVAGITRYTYEEAATTIGDASTVGYPPGRDANILRRGRIFVEGGNAATKSDAVYVGSTGTEVGKFFTAAASGRALIDDNSMSWHAANVIEIRKGL